MNDSSTNTIQANPLQKRQVVPLPIGSGGNNSTKQQMNQLNAQMEMMLVQGTADKKFDPETPPPVTPQVIVKDGFLGNKMESDSISTTLGVIGVLLFVYGWVTK